MEKDIEINPDLQQKFFELNSYMAVLGEIDKRRKNLFNLIDHATWCINGIKVKYNLNDITYLMSNDFNTKEIIGEIDDEIKKLKDTYNKQLYRNDTLNDKTKSLVQGYTEIMKNYIEEIEKFKKNTLTLLTQIEKFKKLNN